MRRKALLGVSIVVGILIALVAMISVAGADPPTPKPPARPNITIPKGRITWSTPIISQTLSAGQLYTATVTFTSTQVLTNPVISIAPNMPVRIRAVPSGYTRVEANTPTELKLEIQVPNSLKAGRQLKFNSLVTVRVGRVALPQGLKVHITVPKTPRPPR